MAHILVVEDDQLLREFIQEVLETKGNNVKTAFDGVDGMKKIRQDPWDLVITDMLMPGRDGIEIIREIKDNHPGVKIIAMSGGGEKIGSHELLPTASMFGADHVLYKPFSIGDILDVIDRVMAP